MKIALPDLVSNSYFPAIAAVDLGLFKAEGLDMTLEMIFPVDKCFQAMADGEVDFIAGSSHAPLAAFPDFKGAKLIGALAHGMYWFLVMRKDLNAKKGDLSVVKGKRIGAAPWVDIGLKRMLAEGGIDIAKDQVEIAPVPGATGPGVSFGVTAAKALEEGKLDGFWANGMGAEVAVTRGVGTIVVDVRRGDGPKGAFGYTQPALVTTDKLIKSNPDAVAAAVRALVATHKTLKADVSQATTVGRKRFPDYEAGLIAELIRRDLPYYDATISEDFVRSMCKFSREIGKLSTDLSYDQVVHTGITHLWKA